MVWLWYILFLQKVLEACLLIVLRSVELNGTLLSVSSKSALLWLKPSAFVYLERFSFSPSFLKDRFPRHSTLYILFVETECLIAQDGLKIPLLLRMTLNFWPLGFYLTECWNYRHVLPCPVFCGAEYREPRTWYMLGKYSTYWAVPLGPRYSTFRELSFS